MINIGMSLSKSECKLDNAFLKSESQVRAPAYASQGLIRRAGTEAGRMLASEISSEVKTTFNQRVCPGAS